MEEDEGVELVLEEFIRELEEEEAAELVEESEVPRERTKEEEEELRAAQQERMKSLASKCLTLEWVFGFSSSVINGVVDLSTTERSALCYVCGHVAIIYDRTTGQQIVLQGHHDAITCLSVNPGKTVVATADIGVNALLVIWSVDRGEALQVIPHGHTIGLVGLKISPDGETLVTLGAGGGFTGVGTQLQQLGVWQLEDVEGVINAHLLLLEDIKCSGEDLQTSIEFNHDQTMEFVTNGVGKVVFWKLSIEEEPGSRDRGVGGRAGGVGRAGGGDGGQIRKWIVAQCEARVITRHIKQSIAQILHSVFLPGGYRAVSSTMEGDLVLWDDPRSSSMVPQDNPLVRERHASKVLRLHNGPITVLARVARYIVTGGSDGYLRFYDSKLRLTAWFEEMDAGPITSISFGISLPREDDDTFLQFQVPDFLVATELGSILAMKGAYFDEMPGSASKKGKVIIRGYHESVVSICMHPSSPVFAMIGGLGLVQLYDYQNKTLMAEKTFVNLRGSSVAISPLADKLAAGFSNGALKVLSLESLEEVQSFRFTPSPIMYIAFSADGWRMATADGGMCVALLIYGHGKMGDKWEYVGKYRSHTGPIRGLQFAMDSRTHCRLFSVGEDGIVVDYDLEGSSTAGGVKLLGTVPISLLDLPAGLVFSPFLSKTLAAGRSAFSSAPTYEKPLLISDSSHRLRLVSIDDMKHVRTHLGPTYGGPITYMHPFEDPNNAKDTAQSNKFYMAFGCRERVAGLLRLPLDDDPTQSMAVVAHSGPLTSIGVSWDSLYMATGGGADRLIKLWKINTAAFEQLLELKENSPGKFGMLLSSVGGGLMNEAQILQEIRDYFYCTQIRSQGEETTADRNITGLVKVSDIPDLMRALGYYPSDAEITELKLEIQRKMNPLKKGTSRVGTRMMIPPSGSTISTSSSKTSVPSTLMPGSPGQGLNLIPSANLLSLDFSQFLSLFINYKPVNGVTKADILKALEDLGGDTVGGKLTRDSLIRALLEEGEQMTLEELNACLTALAGRPVGAANLPQEIDASGFADILGLADTY
ncbi:hypothetical protein CBR_g1046 [Chara braunii]|uniref:Cilia- and flagella-associated protein 251 n=1 Tax=Chara braunii TaxID=69332 RepID=A0A388KD52_CHABU|nr:hypothetical protein CBR_g1046 [Chara braunii]|eukprot:GBG67926.1 hypothetical protein CBR_g1046 [Chara braunii]